MRIAMIGGDPALSPTLSLLAGHRGHSFAAAGGPAEELRPTEVAALARAADVLLVVGLPERHRVAQLAAQLLRPRGLQPVFLDGCGVARFAGLLDALGVQRRRAG